MSRGAVEFTSRGAVEFTLPRFYLPRIQRFRNTANPHPCPRPKNTDECPPGGRPPPERRSELPLRSRARAAGKEQARGRRSSEFETR
jgi:hypothetical protein